MGWLSNLFGGGAAGENGVGPKFGVTVPYEIIKGDAAGTMFSSVRVQRDDALKVPAVLRARNIVAGTLGGLPIHVRDQNRELASPTGLLDQTDPNLPNVVTMAATFEDLLFESVSWWRVLKVGWHGYPSEAEHVPVTRVHASPSGVFIDGLPVRDDQVIRFDSPNPPLLKHAARAIRTCLMLDGTAKLYADTPTSLGYFSPRDGAVDLPEEDIENLLTKWEESRRKHAFGYVGAAWDLGKLGYTAEEIQLMDQRQHAVLEIARATGIPAEDLEVSITSRTYFNAETRRQDRILFTLGPYARAVEQRLSMRDVLPRGYQAKVNFDAFLRPDTKTRMETYAIGLPLGAYTADEIRELEDRPSLTSLERADLVDSQRLEPVDE